MKKVIFIFMMICSFSSCAQETKKIQLISQEEFAKISTKEIQLLDVRTPQEYQQGFIEDAVLVNFFDSDFVTKVSTRFDKINLYTSISLLEEEVIKLQEN